MAVTKPFPSAQPRELPLEILILSSRVPPAACGIADHSFLLMEELQRRSISCLILTSKDQPSCNGVEPRLSGWGIRHSVGTYRTLRQLSPKRVLIQWVPFLYNRWGMNFGIPVLSLLLRAKGFRVETYVHDLWAPLDFDRQFIPALLQRLSSWLLFWTSHKLWLSTDAWRNYLKVLFPNKPKECIPIFSTIEKKEQRAQDLLEFRARNGYSESDSILLLFRPHRSILSNKEVSNALGNLLRSYPHLNICAVGLDSFSIELFQKHFPNEHRVRVCSYLPSPEISQWLQISTVTVCLYPDGVTTRRTTLMAPLSHSNVVIANLGFLSESELWKKSSILLCELEGHSIQTAVEKVLNDPVLQRSSRSSNQEFYLNHFSVSIAAEKLLTAPLTV